MKVFVASGVLSAKLTAMNTYQRLNPNSLRAVTAKYDLMLLEDSLGWA